MQSMATNPAAHPTVMTIEEQVGASLKQFGNRAMPMGYGSWQINQSGDGLTDTMVTVDEDCLVVEQTLSGCRLERIGVMQKWSSRLLGAALDLPSGARPVLPGQDNPTVVRAENNLLRIRAERYLQHRPGDSSDAELHRWIASACADVAVGSVGALPAALSDNLPALRVGESRTGTPCNEATCPDIPALCELAGWPTSTQGTSEETRVPLRVLGDDAGHALAIVSGATIRFQTALTFAPTNETTPACLAAVAVVLLRVAGSVRLVRATLTRVDGSVAAALDVRTQLPLGPENVNHALSSLSVARRQVATEFDALVGDDALASAYLSIQGLR